MEWVQCVQSSENNFCCRSVYFHVIMYIFPCFGIFSTYTLLCFGPRNCIKEGKNVEEAYWELVIKDIQDACDLFLPLYQKSAGIDGYISVEVSPLLANDTQGTIDSAKYLHKRVNRPNVLIKIPATLECIESITQVIASSISVNVTVSMCSHISMLLQTSFSSLQVAMNFIILCANWKFFSILLISPGASMACMLVGQSLFSGCLGCRVIRSTSYLLYIMILDAPVSTLLLMYYVVLSFTAHLFPSEVWGSHWCLPCGTWGSWRRFVEDSECCIVFCQSCGFIGWQEAQCDRHRGGSSIEGQGITTSSVAQNL